MSNDLRVLILADDCNPDWPSVPVFGYKLACAIAERAEVTVATHVRNRPSVDRDGMGPARVVYLDNEYIAAPLFKLGKFIRGGHEVGWTTHVAMRYPANLAFEREAWKRFRNELRDRRFDVVHRITPLSPTLPSPMASWSPVPFVLGPLNGGLAWPAGFEGERTREKEWLVKVRDAYRMLPYYRSTYRNSSAILAGSQHTINDLPKQVRHSERVFDFPEIGIDPALFHARREQTLSAPLNFLFVGRLVPYKQPRVVVEAFATSEKLRQHRCVIVGEGPERPAIEQLIRDANLGDCVKMVGWKSLSEVGQLMREADVFAFPSIRELGAGVVGEAMASGLCCVVVNYGGPGNLVGNDRGVRIPLSPPAEMTTVFKAALEQLADNPAIIRQLGENARTWAMQTLPWEERARRIIEVYRWVTNRRTDRPELNSETNDASSIA